MRILLQLLLLVSLAHQMADEAAADNSSSLVGGASPLSSSGRAHLPPPPHLKIQGVAALLLEILPTPAIMLKRPKTTAAITIAAVRTHPKTAATTATTRDSTSVTRATLAMVFHISRQKRATAITTSHRRAPIPTLVMVALEPKIIPVARLHPPPIMMLLQLLLKQIITNRSRYRKSVCSTALDRVIHSNSRGCCASRPISCYPNACCTRTLLRRLLLSLTIQAMQQMAIRATKTTIAAVVVTVDSIAVMIGLHTTAATGKCRIACSNWSRSRLCTTISNPCKSMTIHGGSQSYLLLPLLILLTVVVVVLQPRHQMLIKRLRSWPALQPFSINCRGPISTNSR